MAETLTFTPVRDSYSVTPTYPIRETILEGAATRKFTEPLYLPHEVSVSWKLNPLQYTNFMGFFRTTLLDSTEYFLMDLVTDIGALVPHRCRTKSGLPRLTQANGSCFYVSATLEVEVNPTYTGLILYEEPNIIRFTHTSPMLVGPIQPGDTIEIFNSTGEHPEGTGEWIWLLSESTNVANFGNVTGFERTDDHSYACWFRTSMVPAGYLFFKQNTAAVRHGPAIFIQAGQVFFNLNNSTAGTNDMSTRTNGAFNDGGTHSLVVTYGGGGGTTVNFYVDGVLVTKTIVQDALAATIINASPLLIGNDSAGFPFDGMLANCAQWTVELTAGDVTKFHNAGQYGDLNSIALSADPSWWVKFDGTDAVGSNNLIDHGPSGFDGTAGGGLEPTLQAGPTDLNLDGIYEVDTVDPNNEVTLVTPELVNSDWALLASLGTPGQYGDETHGNVISTLTRHPRS
jgi:hypothetical protein